MLADLFSGHSAWQVIQGGGYSLLMLLICSVVSWTVILERLWSYRTLSHGMKAFHLEAMALLLRNDERALHSLCARHEALPTSRLLKVALERRASNDSRIRERWLEGLERSRQLVNHELRRFLWILGTIGSAAPFIGLFGTVVGILQSFHAMARSGSGGFAVVAAGISEALVATAAGIIVAVIAVMAYNAFQTRLGALVLMIRVQLEELSEILAASDPAGGSGGSSRNGA